MTEPTSHADAAIYHLREAALSMRGGADQSYHLSAASTHSTLAMVESAQAQAEAVRATTQVNARLLALMVQGEPEAAAAIVASTSPAEEPSNA